MSHHHHQLIPGTPAEFGPGAWWILHLTSYRVDTTDKIPDFINLLHYIAANIPCLMCRHHAADYLHTNNGSKYFDQNYESRHIGMFVWMCDFHNSVNRRNNKRIVPWQEAYAEYKKENERWIEEQKNGLAEIQELEVKRNFAPIRLQLVKEILAAHPHLFPEFNKELSNQVISGEETNERVVNERERMMGEKGQEITEKETNERVMNERERIMGEKEQAITEKEKSIAEKEKSITEKEQAINEKEKAITEKEQAITEKEKSIAEKEKSITEKEQAITEKEKIMTEKEKSINDVHQAKSEELFRLQQKIDDVGLAYNHQLKIMNDLTNNNGDKKIVLITKSHARYASNLL